jgi:hypothetical protein
VTATQRFLTDAVEALNAGTPAAGTITEILGRVIQADSPEQELRLVQGELRRVHAVLVETLLVVCGPEVN